MKKTTKKAAKAAKVSTSQAQAGAHASETEGGGQNLTPAPARRVQRASAEVHDDEPPVGDHRGDKDPAVFEWYCVNDLAAAKKRYVGRTMLGRVMREPDIQRVHDNGGLPDSVKNESSAPATTGTLGDDAQESANLEMPPGAVITE